MTNAVRGFVCGVTIIAVGIFAMACPPKKPVKVIPTNTTATTATQATATTATVPPVETKVDTTQDFVRNPEPQVESSELSGDIEMANRQAQQRGYLQDAFFGYDEAGLSAEAQAALTASATWLKAAGSRYDLLVEGHCDERGTEQYNLALGDRRANTVKDYLAALGVDASRIRTVSYGEERPFDPGHDESSWAKNRRAHLVLAGTTR